MLHSLKLKNIRVFEDGPWLFELPPLTVFCGTNSAGKSTLLKLPLLLQQSQIATGRVDERPGQLRFSGGYVDLGSYAAFVSFNEVERDAVLGVEVDTVLAGSTVAWLRQLGADRPAAPRPHQRKHAPEVHVRFHSEFAFAGSDPSADGKGTDTPHRLNRAEFRFTLDGEELLQWGVSLGTTADATQEGYFLRIPVAYFDAEFAGYGAYEFIHRAGATSEGVVEVGVALRGLLPDAVIAAMGAVGAPDGAPPIERRLPLPLDIASPLEDLRRALDGVRYLGPLRSPAERFYVAAGEGTSGMDASGEFLPYVLRDRADELVTTLGPDGAEPEKRSLAEALNVWLHYLRTGEARSDAEGAELDVAATKRVLVELHVRGATGEGTYALADSGFGYSQVLPILVRGLLTAPGETLVVEQPELHLHPGLQIRLASFFAALAKSGRQLLLETHSEHIVNAVRVAAAEDSSGVLPGLTGVFFIEADHRPPKVHSLALRPDGSMPDWPPAFFGEALSLTGRLLRAQRKLREGDK